MAGEDNKSGAGLTYPLTNMNFLVKVDTIDAIAAFTEVSGVEATVEEIEFRQGNSNSLAPMKIPGLVKHGSVSLKMGYTVGNGLAKWMYDCVSETRQAFTRHDVTIELIDISQNAPTTAPTAVGSGAVWVLKNAWVTKYSAPDLNASGKEVAIESIDLAYEELTMPGAGTGAAQ